MSEPGTGPGPDGPSHESGTDRYNDNDSVYLGFVRASQLSTRDPGQHIADHDQATVPEGVTLLEDLRADRQLDEDEREQVRDDPVLELSDFSDPEGSA